MKPIIEYTYKYMIKTKIMEIIRYETNTMATYVSIFNSKKIVDGVLRGVFDIKADIKALDLINFINRYRKKI